MSDSDKPNLRADFAPMVMTGTGSSAIGDQVGNGLADIVTWLIELGCKCTPPVGVITAFHTIGVAATVAFAFYIHYRFVKPEV